MERLCTLLMGSAIALMAYGSAVASERTHELIVRLRDGSVEHIRYFGDQPPMLALAGVRAGISYPLMTISSRRLSWILSGFRQR